MGPTGALPAPHNFENNRRHWAREVSGLLFFSRPLRLNNWVVASSSSTANGSGIMDETEARSATSHQKVPEATTRGRKLASIVLEPKWLRTNLVRTKSAMCLETRWDTTFIIKRVCLCAGVPPGTRAIDVTKPYKFIGCRAIDVTKPYVIHMVLGNRCHQTL